MNYPEIFPLVSQDAGCIAVLGTNPTRFWPFGQAPQNETRPYAVHQLVSAQPSGNVAGPSCVDSVSLQIDAYAQDANGARAVANAIAKVIDNFHGVVSSWNGESIDDPTGLYRVIFTADFFTKRT